MIFDIDAVEEKIGYTFKDKMLLRQAFTHSSYAYEHNQPNNELLEFFGDSILEFLVTEYLYKKVRGDEGLLTKFRAEMVSKEPLNQAMQMLDLSKYILLGNGQKKNLDKDDKLFSSVFEALVCAMYIDGGITCAKKFINNTLVKQFKQNSLENKTQPNDASSKSQFQEFVQKHKLGKIEYKLISKSGPDHMAEFCVALLLNGTELTRQTGFSKKSAEAKSATIALKNLKVKKDGKKN